MEVKQGEVGDISKLPNYKLIELLKRQEQILKDFKCLSRLPDKGQKIKLFKKKLEDEIKERGNVDKAAEMLQKMDLQASEKLAEESKEFIANGNKVLNQEEKSIFKPSESLRSKSIPENLQRPNVMPVSKVKSSSKSQNSNEYSNVVSPLGKFEKIIALPLDESHKLLVQQKEKYEYLQAMQAAERLAERMHLTLGDYSHHAGDAYREAEEESSGDEDETGGKADLTDLIEET